MISKRVVEAVLLSHHLSEYDEPHRSYVVEKTEYEWPSLDKQLSAIFEQINAVFRMNFGVEANKNKYHFTNEDVK